MAMADTTKGPKLPVNAKPAERRERGGWLAKIAPGVSKLVSKRETPENLWVKDPDTGDMIYRSDLEAALWVTPSGRHMRIGPKARMKFTFDDGQFESLPTPEVVEDPLHFSDGKPYKDRLKAARNATGDAVTSRGVCSASTTLIDADGGSSLLKSSTADTAFSYSVPPFPPCRPIDSE